MAQRLQAVLVPSDALHDADHAGPWVFKVDGRHARRQPVRLGLRGGGVSEVLDGLQAGDLVLPARTSGIRDGQRLRAVAVPAETGAPLP